MRFVIYSIILSHLVRFIKADIVIISPANRTTEIFDNVELAFGSIPLEGISGKLILAEPEDACQEIKKAPNKDENWFLLAKRYPCPFEIKVRNAAKAGFKAVIIYSIDPGKKSSQVHPSPKVQYNLHIPTTLISYIDGEDIKQNYLYDKGYKALILPRIPFPINAYLLPFAIAIIVCLFLMVSFLVFQIIKCARDRRNLQRHRLTNRQLKQLLTTIYTKGSNYDTCAICLEEYLEGEKLRVLPCGHGYHIRCIDPWLTKSRRICPVCKGKVRVSGMSDVSDTESERDHSTHETYNANESTPLLREATTRPTTTRYSTRNNTNSGSTSSGSTTNHNNTASTNHHHRSYQQRHGTRPSMNGSINGAYSDHGSLSSTTPDGSSRQLYVDAES